MSVRCDQSAGDLGGPEAQFAAALEQGYFRIQRCTACSKHAFYPRALCPHCGAAEHEWVEASGAGHVYSTTTVRRRPQAGGDYNIALVDLVEGPRLMSRIDGIPTDQVRIGMSVTARVVDDPTKGKILVFMAAAGTP